jgi:hypothetical protein
MTIHEPATVATDYLLSGFTAVLAWRVMHASRMKSEWHTRWGLAFTATAIASLAGGTVHGFPHILGPPGTHALWLVTMTALIVASMGIVLASVLRWPVSGVSRRAATVSIAASYTLYAVWLLMHPAFVFAIGAYGAALIVLLGGELAFHRREPTVRPFSWGVGVSALAAAVQQSGWIPHRYFNYNDVYHVLQAVAIWMLYRGATCAWAPVRRHS